MQAYLNDFQFALCGVDIGPTSPVSVSSMKANGIDILANSVYNPADTSLTAFIDNNYFSSISDINPLEEDDQFDTDEKVTIQVCYEVASCPDNADVAFIYKAWYGCFDEICETTGKASFLKIRPTGSADPIATADFQGPLQICRDSFNYSRKPWRSKISEFQYRF